MLYDFTTYAEIRAALGVSEEELSDDTLGLEIHSLVLEDNLNELSGSLLTAWSALPVPSARSADQTKFAGLLKMYCTYAVAYSLLDSAELFGFLKVADGRASTERVPEAYTSLRANITAMYTRLRAKLLAALVVLVPAADVPVRAPLAFISAVGIALDPVTNA